MSRFFHVLLPPLLAALAGWPAGASAQATAVVLPTLQSEADAQPADALAIALERELTAHGFAPVAPPVAAERFAEGYAAPALTPEHDTFDELARCMDEVLVLTASRRIARARDLGRRCLGLAESALETLNRRTEAAQQLLDGCLYGVRAILDGGRLRRNPTAEREAMAEARRCRTLVPDLHPTARMHPPGVLQAFEQVEEQLARSRSELRVTSEEDGCSVYLNGRRMGTTDFHGQALPGSVFRVQVECRGVPGRVHRIQIGSEPLILAVDERFESAIADAPRLTLRYPGRMAAAGHRLDDARRIALTVDVLEAWLLVDEGEDNWRVDRMLVPTGRIVASARVNAPGGDAGDALGRAVELLSLGESADLSSGTEAPMDAWVPDGQEPPPAVDAPVASDGGWSPHPLAWAGVITGAAGLLGATGLYIVAGSDETYDATLARTQTGIGVAGAALLAVSLPFWLPEEDGVPLWSILPGVVGAGLVAAGAMLMATHGCSREREDGECIEFVHSDLSGVWVLAAGIPFLEIPVVYLLREAFGSSAPRPQVTASAHGAVVSLGGSL